jgi:multicomponent K+:H+ antiporter subunit F
MINAYLPMVLRVAEVMLALAMVCAVIRLLRGPRAQDRVLALDTLYVHARLRVDRSARALPAARRGDRMRGCR